MYITIRFKTLLTFLKQVISYLKISLLCSIIFMLIYTRISILFILFYFCVFSEFVDNNGNILNSQDIAYPAKWVKTFSFSFLIDTIKKNTRPTVYVPPISISIHSYLFPIVGEKKKFPNPNGKKVHKR